VKQLSVAESNLRLYEKDKQAKKVRHPVVACDLMRKSGKGKAPSLHLRPAIRRRREPDQEPIAAPGT
jgi:hypothetical protein